MDRITYEIRIVELQTTTNEQGNLKGYQAFIFFYKNGNLDMIMLYDSGCSNSTISPTSKYLLKENNVSDYKIENINQQNSSSIQGGLYNLKNFFNEDVLLFTSDVSHINKHIRDIYADQDKTPYEIDGIFGLDLMIKHNIFIDNKRLVKDNTLNEIVYIMYPKRFN